MNQKLKKTPGKRQDSGSEMFEQQKLEKLNDGSTVPEEKNLNQSLANQSAIKLNQLKQIQKTDAPLKNTKHQLSKSNNTPSSQIEQGSERAKYAQLAETTRLKLGNISQLRLDMEVYYRVTLLENNKTKGEGKKVLKQSSKYRQLAKQDPKLAKQYLNAIANSVPTFKRLPENTKNLDSVADRLVNLNLTKQVGNKEIGSSPIHKTKSQEGQQLEQYRKNAE